MTLEQDLLTHENLEKITISMKQFQAVVVKPIIKSHLQLCAIWSHPLI